MRLPAALDRLSGRLGALLVAGQLLTIAATLAVFLWSDSLHGGGWNQAATTIERIALLASAMQRVPAEARASLAAALDGAGLHAGWHATAQPSGLRRDPMTRHVERDLATAGKPYGLAQPEVGAMADDASLLQARVPLADGSWLVVEVPRDAVGALALERLLAALAILMLGVGALAVWAARRATAPLVRLAAAAQRLGADLHAPPLAPDGPVEIRAAAHAFNRMQQRLVRLVEDRTVLLAAISHDLRTVLTRLALRVEAIEDPVQRERGRTDVFEMQAMLRDTLSLASDAASGSREPPRALDLALLLQGLCDEAADSGRCARYSGPAHLRFVGRAVLLRRVFANLLDNALFYGGTADVALAAGAEALEITVADRGPGIPAALREKVFAPFFRIDTSRSRDTGGAGLGLAIARSGAHQHGGEIELEDRPGGGLIARVRLPRA